MALTRPTSSGGKNPGSAGAGKVFQASQSFFEEPFSPAADDLAARTEAVGDLVIRKALLSEEDHLGRATIKYGNVYLLARRSSSPRSFLVRTILYGLLRGKLVPSPSEHSREGAKTANNTLSYL